MYWVDIIFGKEIWSPVPDCLHHHFALILLYLSILILSWGRVLLGVTRRYLFVWQKCWRPSKVFQAWISRLVNILLQSQWHWCTIFSRSHEWFIFNKTWKTISLVPAPERLRLFRLCRDCACLDGDLPEIGRAGPKVKKAAKEQKLQLMFRQGVGDARRRRGQWPALARSWPRFLHMLVLMPGEGLLFPAAEGLTRCRRRGLRLPGQGRLPVSPSSQ